MAFRISLKAARVNAEMNQRQAAEALGVDTSTIVSWETGKTSPSASRLLDICRVYNIPIDNIFLRSESISNGR